MKRLYRYIWRYRFWYTIGVLFTLGFTILTNLLPLLMRDATNAVRAGHPDRLVRISMMMVAVAGLMGVARALSRIITFNTGR
ncbi:MAG TPA: hypothetical protein VNU00_04400, partial [Candidatus Binataceae bacterium]|nr:hypothetical protein [Candidatus Binataceae bacterium]